MTNTDTALSPVRKDLLTILGSWPDPISPSAGTLSRVLLHSRGMTLGREMVRRHLQALVAEGLIADEGAPRGSRPRNWQLTDKGRAALAAGGL